MAVPGKNDMIYTVNYRNAKFAKVTIWDKTWFLFEIGFCESVNPNLYDPNHYNGGNLPCPPSGRLVEAKNKEGFGFTISHQPFTSQQLAESPSRFWQRDTVTATNGQTMSFEYLSQQQGGNWVVSSVTLLDAQEIAYEYIGGGKTGGKLGGKLGTPPFRRGVLPCRLRGRLIGEMIGFP